MAELDLEGLLTKSTALSSEQARTLLLRSSSGLGSSALSIGEHLRAKQYSSVEDLVAELCSELGLEFIRDIPVHEIPLDLLRDLPINYAKQQSILPFKIDGDTIIAITANPVNTRAVEDLRMLLGKRVKVFVSTHARVQDAINRAYERSTASFSGLEDLEGEDLDLEEQITDLLEAGDDDAPVIKLVNSLLFRAVKEKASDIHVEPFERDMSVRFRIDGVLFDIYKPPKRLQNAVLSRLKVMANLNIAEKRLPQDGRIPIRMGGKDIDIRVSSVPTSFGERIVMRLQDRSNVILELEQLGFSEQVMENLGEVLKRSDGIFFVTGPTGSGKSTTLYASLARLNSPDVNILTIEDPVEQRIHGVGQVQVNAKIGLTFASGLRSFLRQDPDVIMVGEIRDRETADLAINASLTGHFVLTTIHANDSAGAFPRMIDLGSEPFLIATSTVGVLAQRLVRILCPHCKTRFEPGSVDWNMLGVDPSTVKGISLHRAKGCDKCNQKGYLGRTVISELMVIDDELRSLIMQKKDGNSIRKMAISKGMKTFRDHGVQKVLAGITTIEELLANTSMDL